MVYVCVWEGEGWKSSEEWWGEGKGEVSSGTDACGRLPSLQGNKSKVQKSVPRMLCFHGIRRGDISECL